MPYFILMPMTMKETLISKESVVVIQVQSRITKAAYGHYQLCRRKLASPIVMNKIPMQAPNPCVKRAAAHLEPGINLLPSPSSPSLAISK
jgi:hypothetical protein